MTRALILLLCFFIPVSAWRKAFRSKFVGPISRPKRMKRFNKIADWRFEDVDGVKVATGVLRNGATIRLGVFDQDVSAISTPIAIFDKDEYHFAGYRKSIVVDIGMNHGYASLYFALRDDVDSVYAFEPVKSVYEKALFNFSLNECAKKIIAYNYGLGDSDKQADVGFDPAHSGKTSIISQKRFAGENALAIQVKDAAPIIRDIIANHPDSMIVIKSDCEGAEGEIFQRLDAENILPSIDVIVMEYHLDQDRFIESVLAKHEFVCFKQPGSSRAGIIRAARSGCRKA